MFWILDLVCDIRCQKRLPACHAMMITLHTPLPSSHVLCALKKGKQQTVFQFQWYQVWGIASVFLLPLVWSIHSD